MRKSDYDMWRSLPLKKFMLWVNLNWRQWWVGVSIDRRFWGPPEFAATMELSIIVNPLPCVQVHFAFSYGGYVGVDVD